MTITIGTKVRVLGRVEFHVTDGLGSGYDAAIENVVATVVGTGPRGILFVDTAMFPFVKVPGNVPVEVV